MSSPRRGLSKIARDFENGKTLRDRHRGVHFLEDRLGFAVRKPTAGCSLGEDREMRS